MRPLRAQSGRQVRQIRKIPRLSGLSRMQVYKAHRRAHAGQMPALRQYDSQAQEQARLCLLCLRTGRGVRLYDVGRANRERLPGMRADHVQAMFKKAGKGFKKPFCINPDCKNFLPEEKRGYRKKPAAAENAEQAADEANLPPEPAAAEAEVPKTAKKPAAKKTAAKKPAAKKTASAKTAATKKTATKKAKNTAAEDAGEAPKKSASRRKKKEDAT